MNTMTEGQMGSRPSWWSRNWKWVVPSGCLGLLLSCGCLGALFFGIVSQTLRGSGVFVEAVAQAQQSPEVRQALGEPVGSGMMLQGSIESSNERGSANFSVPLKGSKADGTLYVEAYKNEDKWTFTTLTVEVPGRPDINLLGGPAAPPGNTVPFPDSLPEVEPLPDDDTPETGEPAEPEHQEPEDKKKNDIQL